MYTHIFLYGVVKYWRRTWHQHVVLGFKSRSRRCEATTLDK